MKFYLIKKALFVLIIFLGFSVKGFCQLDSIVKAVSDTIISKLIVDDIPKKTFKDKLMYPHRWYVKQLLKPKQTDFDTTYITSHKHKLTITIPFSRKYYGFSVKDLQTNSIARFSPNSNYHIGFNFSNIILTFGFVPAINFGARPERGKTKSVDFQFTLIGKRVITDINYQNYKGFYIHNSADFNSLAPTLNEFILRPEINAEAFGVNTMFVYNHKKYSLRGAFSFTDVQRKSSASFMTGLYHSRVVFSSQDSFFIKPPLTAFFSEQVNNINSLSIIDVGVSAGYGYNIVYKRLILSSAFNLGLGAQKTNYKTIYNQSADLAMRAAYHINAKAAIRYDNVRFFVGLLASYDSNFTWQPKEFNVPSYISRTVLFVGYRFNVKQNGRKLLKAMGLVDFKVKR